MPGYDDMMAETERFLAGIHYPLRARLAWWHHVVVVGGVALCLGLAVVGLFLPIEAWRDASIDPLARLVVAVLGSIFSLLFAIVAIGAGIGSLYLGTMEMDREGVALSTPLGRYGMKWSEVTAVERPTAAGTLFPTLVGGSKRLVLDGFWSGPDLQAMSDLLATQITRSGIRAKYSWMANFQITTKNTRLP